MRRPRVRINKDLDHGRHAQEPERRAPRAQAQHEQQREQVFGRRRHLRRQLGRQQRQRVLRLELRIRRCLDREKPLDLRAAGQEEDGGDGHAVEQQQGGVGQQARQVRAGGLEHREVSFHG
jgi:hypothetical protein